MTLERAVSFVVPDFVQVEVPGEFADEAATILAQPADVASRGTGQKPALPGGHRRRRAGALVLAGLACGTNATGLAHLLALDVPRVTLLGATAGLANVRRQGARHRG